MRQDMDTPTTLTFVATAFRWYLKTVCWRSLAASNNGAISLFWNGVGTTTRTFMAYGAIPFIVDMHWPRNIMRNPRVLRQLLAGIYVWLSFVKLPATALRDSVPQ